MYTLEQAKAELLEICRQYPERNGTVGGGSPSCFYYLNREGKGVGLFDWENGVARVVTASGPEDLVKPCCLVGELIERHREEWIGFPGVFSGIRQNLRASEALSDAAMTDEVREMLDAVQQEQDGGVSWGDLVELIESFEAPDSEYDD